MGESLLGGFQQSGNSDLDDGARRLETEPSLFRRLHRQVHQLGRRAIKQSGPERLEQQLSPQPAEIAEDQRIGSDLRGDGRLASALVDLARQVTGLGPG